MSSRNPNWRTYENLFGQLPKRPDEGILESDPLAVRAAAKSVENSCEEDTVEEVVITAAATALTRREVKSALRIGLYHELDVFTPSDEKVWPPEGGLADTDEELGAQIETLLSSLVGQTYFYMTSGHQLSPWTYDPAIDTRRNPEEVQLDYQAELFTRATSEKSLYHVGIE